MKKMLALSCVFAAWSDAPVAQRDWPDVAQLPERKELPDPLVTFDGRRVTTPEQWEKERKPELRALFQHYMYGFLPKPRTVVPTVRRTDPMALGGKATLKEIAIPLGEPPAPVVDLLLVVPNRRGGPAPIFAGLNFSGNHSLLDDPRIAIPKSWMRQGPEVENNRAAEKGRGKRAESWAIEPSIDRGYAVATVYYGDIFPDKADFSEGLYPALFKREPGQKSPGATGPGAIAMWAWGLHRIVDCLASDPDIDRSRIAVMGHSRLGKTALVAAAFDERIALAVPHQAGCGGTAPNRTKNPKAETVKVINKSFPHWFCDNFKKFGDEVDRLPFDQHCLLALCAPRPVLYSNALEDQWADPPGQFQLLQAASAVYRLYGGEGLGAAEMPPLGKLVDSPLGYFIRPGKHSTTPEDWKVFLDFADRHFKRR